MKRRRIRGVSIRLRGVLTAAAAAVALGFTGGGDYASDVTAFSPGPLGASEATEALGPPTGAGLFEGSFDVTTLGVSGVLTLQFGNTCLDGAGTDLLVCENPFLVGGGSTSFAETLFVEVSSDGHHFARFPTRYSGPQSQLPPIEGAVQSWFRGFAGVRPVLANPSQGIDPHDVVHAGGDAFDFADLAGDPLVQSGLVDLQAIRYVRLSDIDSGHVADSTGTTVWDCGLDSSSSADIDAIVAVNSDDNQTPGRPQVELSLDAQNFLTISVSDSDGWKDVKNGLSASLDQTAFPFAALLPLCALTHVDSFSFTLVTGPIPPGMFPYELRIGATDSTGLSGGDAIALP